MAIHLHHDDLPANVSLKGDIAVDTETMGLCVTTRDRLCLVQISDGQGDAHLIKFDGKTYQAPNLVRLLGDPARVKIFHFARFDITAIKRYLGLEINNLYCTRTASRLVRTYTDKHGLKDICKELLDVEIVKEQQTSNWGAPKLSKAQLDYAAADVLYLHRLREKLDVMLETEGRAGIARRCFEFLPTRAELDILGWQDVDILAHS